MPVIYPALCNTSEIVAITSNPSVPHFYIYWNNSSSRQKPARSLSDDLECCLPEGKVGILSGLWVAVLIDSLPYKWNWFHKVDHFHQTLRVLPLVMTDDFNSCHMKISYPESLSSTLVLLAVKQMSSRATQTQFIWNWVHFLGKVACFCLCCFFPCT